jgi:hypothetical protein
VVFSQLQFGCYSLLILHCLTRTKVSHDSTLTSRTYGTIPIPFVLLKNLWNAPKLGRSHCRLSVGVSTTK